MRTKIWTLAAGLFLVGMTAPAMATGWSGPGWYIAINLDYGDGEGPMDYINLGPYSSEADCKTAWSALSKGEQHVYGNCGYFASDPEAN
jgi:hypothetical protein